MKNVKVSRKTLNRNPFNEKLIHRFYLESLYFGSNSDLKLNLIPLSLGKKVRMSNLALIVPEDSNESGYRPDFMLYFKGYSKPVPVEVKWKTSDFKKKNQVSYIKKNKGFVVAFEEDVKLDVPTVILKPKDFQNWMAKRIYTLTRDSLSSKDILETDTNKWLVAIRGKSGLENFKKMINASKNHFWAFKNSKYVTRQIFNLQKNDEMIFIFFKSTDDAMSMSHGHPERIMEIYGWATVSVTEPYYICLEGERSSFFEEIRYTKAGPIIPVHERKWVHFIDFSISEFHNDLIIARPRGSIDSYVVESANQGGALTIMPNSEFEELKSFLVTSQNCKKAS